MTTISMMNTTFNYQDFLYKMNISVPLFYNNVLDKMNTTTNYTLIYENIKDYTYMTYNNFINFLFLNNEIISKVCGSIFLIMFLFYIFALFNYQYQNQKLLERCDSLSRHLHISKQENKELKRINKHYKTLSKYYKDENEKLKEPNFHRENGVRKSLRAKQKNEIIEEIIIVKDSHGMAYIPSWEYNGIGDLEPGQGYQIKLSSEQILIYDAND